MKRCFVIQPFDNGKFDKRYEDVYKPAIEAAGLESYRVDKDFAVTVLIDAIESEIRKASICLVDITTNNPNVWYELGYAFAANIPVVMICSNERKDDFPFDIKHRKVLTYLAESHSDFEKLTRDITATIKVLIEKTENDKSNSNGCDLTILPSDEAINVDRSLPIKLVMAEKVLLTAIADNSLLASDPINVYLLKTTAKKWSVSGIEFHSAFRRLHSKGFVEFADIIDDQGHYVEGGIRISEIGWSWIDANQKEFASLSTKEEEDFDDAIPF